MHNSRIRTARKPGVALQRGVAVVTALLLTTLAVTIVASMFWQQHVQVRSIENQRTQAQKQWILRGLIDWEMLILRTDTENSHVDHLGEPWAAPMATVRVEDYLDKVTSDSGIEALLSGTIVDAQSRYNLRNLAPGGQIDPNEVAVLQRLLAALHLDSALAQRTAGLLASANADRQVLRVEQLEDLYAIPGMSQGILDRLKDHVVLLPIPTPVNVNTASAEVLAARLGNLSNDEIVAFITSRGRAYVRDEGDLRTRLQDKSMQTFSRDISVSSNYFLLKGKIRFNQSSREMHALLERHLMIGSRLVWVREN